MSTLIPILLLTGSGIVFSLLLIFASKIFKIDDDCEFNNVRNCLPGINCSVCGYASCDEYARGILDGDVITKCRPGGKVTQEKLKKVLDHKKQVAN